MSDRSNIEWTDATWNPIRGIGPNRWQCLKISPGCDHCYASTMNHRFGGQEYAPVGSGDPASRLDFDALRLPFSWRQPRRVFVCSMSDLFGEWVPDEWIDLVFAAMRDSPRHQFQVLTKRPTRMRRYMETWDRLHGRNGLHNIWFGTTIESDAYTWRANEVRQIDAAVRFISAEPLLGPLPSLDLTGIDWLITGGESGAGHRPFELDWVRDLRDRARAADVPFFHKQHGGRTHAEGGCLVDGIEIKEFPRARAA